MIATARPAKAELMRTLGAAETVDHTAGSVADQVLAAHPDGVDVLIDMTGGPEEFGKLTRTVRDGGIAVSLIGSADADELTDHNLRGFNFVNRPSPQLLEILAGQVDAGRLTVLVGREVPWRRRRKPWRPAARAGRRARRCWRSEPGSIHVGPDPPDRP